VLTIMSDSRLISTPNCFKALCLNMAKGFHILEIRLFDETSLNQPRMSRERPYEIFGHPSWPKEASRKGEREALPAPASSQEQGV
jgi:hypothetical protein